MQIQINGNKQIEFTPQGISYILDMLAQCPWKVANPLINDIMEQLKKQELSVGEVKDSGSESS